MKPILYVALDGLATNEAKTIEIVEKLLATNEHFGLKLNLDYLINSKKNLKEAIEDVKVFNRPIFADIKMWNGSRTMKSVIQSLIDLEVEFTNVYLLADDQLPEVISITRGTKTKILGLTVLTHYDDEYCRRHYGRSMPETVRHFSDIAITVGCHGIILPGPALYAVKDLKNIIKTVPGVRPKKFKDNRHKEEIEPGEAILNGANIIVVGSPIMKSDDPAESMTEIISEIMSV